MPAGAMKGKRPLAVAVQKGRFGGGGAAGVPVREKVIEIEAPPRALAVSTLLIPYF
jgi:hypothetical protein